MAAKHWDLFISHAHEDKEDFVRPLAEALRRRGLRVWYDEFSLHVGDSLRQSIEQGLRESRYGIVILSMHFFRKEWTNWELDGLVSRQFSGREKVIIPIWHGVTKGDVENYSPSLADKLALSSALELSDLVRRILDEIHPDVSNLDLTKTVPTEIRRLDQALRGGLPRGTSIVIQGPMGIGKSTLGMQIQLAALERGEPCLYITYRDPPTDVINRMNDMSGKLGEHIQKGIFKVFDNFSALHGFSRHEIDNDLPPEWRSAIVRVENPEDVEEYYELQCATMEEMGLGGVNVIDSTNERFELLGDPKESRRYFQRFRARLARLGKQTAIHIVSDHADEKFAKVLSDFEDGLILMKFEDRKGERHRYLRIESLRDTSFDEVWFEFIITDEGLEVF